MSAKALMGAVPAILFGGMSLYLHRLTATMDPLVSQQLMPIIYGLGVLGFLFSLPVLLKLFGLAIGGTRKPAKAARERDDGPAAFDPDAAISRYLEKKAAGEVSYEMPDTAAPHPTFGRKLA